MLRKYVKKFGKLPERPEHLVAFSEKYGGVRFVDARAAMNKLSGIDALPQDPDEDERREREEREAAEAAAAAREKEERKKKQLAAFAALSPTDSSEDAEDDTQDVAAVSIAPAPAPAPKKSSGGMAIRTSPAMEKAKEAAEKSAIRAQSPRAKSTLRHWLLKHGFGAVQGLEVIDAVDIREIDDFEFVEVRDLVDGGMSQEVAERLLQTFAEYGTSLPPVGSTNSPPPGSNFDQGKATPQLLKPQSRRSPKTKSPTKLPAPALEDSDLDEQAAPSPQNNDQGNGSGEFAAEFDTDPDEEDTTDAAQAINTKEPTVPAITSPAVHKAVSNSARRQARWHARVESFLQEHDPALVDDSEYIDGLLEEYRGREVALLRMLRDKYTKPAPEDSRKADRTQSYATM